VGAALGQIHPTHFVVQPLANPGVEALIGAQRERAGIGQIPSDAVRRVYERLRANQWVAMLADQDARRAGVFVPFLGRPASTAIGPARIALATGAPIVAGFSWREPDGRHRLVVDAPLEIEAPEAADAALRLTAAHVRRLEQRIRERPEQWFWLHRRWKTTPPADPDTVPAAQGKDG
jgi:KDO2-lipid IV(A) lauroyltransferase